MPAPQTEVIITVDGKEHARHILTPGDYVVGRNADCPIRVDADLVSRRHAMLVLNYDHALIEDLGSANGTAVNGQPVTGRTRLWPNQKIQVGLATLELRRLRHEATNMSLAPAAAMVKRALPEEFLREKKYGIGRVVAQGGMGAILDAREATTERTIAMKVMLDTNDPDALVRFLNEAKITAQLEHPNIVPIHELSVDENGQPYYTMKMVRGITLKKVLELLAGGVGATAKKYPLPTLLTIFQKVCDAIAFAHSRGVIHRDLKPENIMLGDYGEALVMDWGLAKRMKEDTAAPQEEIHTIRQSMAVQTPSPFDLHPSSLPMEATQAGTIMGTPQFMSPEQARGEVETLNARSDIYSLGAILYQILALRVSVSGADAMEVVGKVGRGEIEPLECGGKRSATPLWQERSDAAGTPEPDAKPGPGAPRPAKAASLPPHSKIPGSLAAVVRKAMALDPAARYPRVEDLQADILAYQNGFATSAENASAWKQFTLLIRRNKAASIGIATVIVLTVGFTAKVIAEGNRAKREAARAERGEAKAKAALADLKASAPALLQLAGSEADSQRFASALGKLDAALALDPALHRARWQRAWVLLALDRWSEAADALRLANEHDPANAKLASILPAVEKLAILSDVERWKSEAAHEVFHHLESIGTNSSALVIANKLRLDAQERRKLAEQRLIAAFGKGNYSLSVSNDGLVCLSLNEKQSSSFEPLRGLPIDCLNSPGELLADSGLEPLRGMHLQSLSVHGPKVSDLSPLYGMPLNFLAIIGASATDLTPLKGMRLATLIMGNTRISNIEALRGMPLRRLDSDGWVRDYSPVKGAPLESLDIAGAGEISDLSFVRGMPLRSLRIEGAPHLTNLAPLRGLPLENLNMSRTPVGDLSPLAHAALKTLDIRNCKKITDFTPILTLTKLERLSLDVLPESLLPLRESATLQSIEADAYPGEGSQGARPVADFWHAYDAWKAKQAK